MAKKVKLNRDVLYRGRRYVAGEPIVANEIAIKTWQENNFILYNEEKEDETDKKLSIKATPVTTSTPPGKVEGGTGAEGEMPGKIIGRKSKK